MSTNALRAADKLMFEIYREGHYNRTYRVVYYTELNDHNREHEFNKALAGENVFDGFLAGPTKERAKEIIKDLLSRLNSGEDIGVDQMREALAEHLV